MSLWESPVDSLWTWDYFHFCKLAPSNLLNWAGESAMCVPHSCQPPSSISCALFHISCAWIHSSSTKWWFVLRNYYRICCCCKVTWFALYLCQECMLTAVWQSKMDYSNSSRFFSSGIFLQTWNFGLMFFQSLLERVKMSYLLHLSAASDFV